MRFNDMIIGQFIDKLASDAPAPGGGSAAAVTATMGCALVSMVANLTVGRDEYKDHEEQVKIILLESEELRRKLIVAADQDAKAFEYVMEVFRMPKGTSEQKEKRAGILQDALKEAAIIPMGIARMSLDVMKLAWNLHDKANPIAISDIGVAALMAKAGLEGAILNVEINLCSIKDEAFIDKMRRDIQEVTENGNRIFKNIMIKVKL